MIISPRYSYRSDTSPKQRDSSTPSSFGKLRQVQLRFDENVTVNLEGGIASSTTARRPLKFTTNHMYIHKTPCINTIHSTAVLLPRTVSSNTFTTHLQPGRSRSCESHRQLRGQGITCLVDAPGQQHRGLGCTRWYSMPPSLGELPPSIVAHIDQPLDIPASFPGKGLACRHNGADWEDCRLVIHCFAVTLNNGTRQAATTTQSGSSLLPHAFSRSRLVARQHSNNIDTPSTKKRTSAVEKWPVGKPVVARSVRLSIVPLCPIYRRKDRRRRTTVQTDGSSAHTRRRSASRELLAKAATTLANNGRVIWAKRLVQRMAFKIDDFTIQEDQVKTAKDVFKRFDKRGQDKISTTDLGPAFRALSLKFKADTLKVWADQVDDDATGFIDFKGFLICYGRSLQEEQDERDLRDAFRVLDKNKRGEIDVEDLRWILKELGDDLTEEEIDDMIRDTDTDGSGFVDFDEFYKLMTSE